MLARLGGICLLLGAGCERTSYNPGDSCELNTDCDPRLVCRLERCRVECRAQRDCAAGLQCVRDEDGFGACQLEFETSCTQTSDCDSTLVCQFGQCTNICNGDRDCPAGARCVEEDGTRACLDMSERECNVNSECGPLLICAVDGRCRDECVTDRDCRDGLLCRFDLYESPVCASADAQPDAGLDGGPTPLDGGMDGGMSTGVPSWALLAAGLNHSCARRPTGETACWGGNDAYQIGDGTMGDATAARPLALTDVGNIGAGAAHSCVLSNGQLWCWGASPNGEAGASDPTTAPAMIAGLPTPITDLTLGDGHTCVIANGQVHCWGRNDVGQLGLGDTASRTSPTAVTITGTPAQVSAFGRTTCVRNDAGAVFCFGQGGEGQIGNGADGVASSPEPVSGLTDAVQIAAGTTFACALRATGSVVCWGSDFFEQLGDGPGRANQNVPVPVGGLTGVDQIALGSAHACARVGSSVWCWGDNTFAQSGQDPGLGAAFQRFDMPSEVPALTGVDAVGCGTNHTCVRVGSDVRCFGANLRGQLGNGTTSTREHLPQMVMWP